MKFNFFKVSIIQENPNKLIQVNYFHQYAIIGRPLFGIWRYLSFLKVLPGTKCCQEIFKTNFCEILKNGFMDRYKKNSK